ncbi:hypothetical protein GJV85_12675 [Sulfurimonas aquatica]|uniref:ABC-type transport auxiliary lipoprotein component domain-containing protein n=1 Tax=Sulfurimonas aquatica TaxID=2672570 RepID=A0A975GE18_9BACT|nr:YajG family lipoprotein [Sulfurimonas aquatica]QSZ42924.1 hypothetical protein GJV85_12675 [Sulfurimonas aquatica]
MKKLSYIVVLALMLVGCSYKNNPVVLESYKADYSGEIAPKNTTVFLSSVKDTRLDKRSIGYVLEGDKKAVTLFSEDDFEKKYKDGLGHALNIAGFDTDVKKNEATLVVNIFIKEINVVYTNESFDENLKGKIMIEASVKKGDKTLTFNFKQQSGKWISPSYNSKDVAPLLHMLFSDSINDVVAKLTSL